MSLAPEESSDARCDLPGAVSSNGLVISPPTDAVDFESSESSRMNSLVARTGRHQQRYECGYRLVAGCVPFRYKSENAGNGDLQQTLEVLMVSTQGGPGLLFPKGGWETDETVEEAACREALEEAGVKGQLTGSLGLWDFKSKRQQGDYSPEGLCRAHMFALAVTEELDTWPEQHSRQRQWVSMDGGLQKLLNIFHKNSMLLRQLSTVDISGCVELLTSAFHIWVADYQVLYCLKMERMLQARIRSFLPFFQFKIDILDDMSCV